MTLNSPTLSQALAAIGYSHTPSGRGYAHDVVDAAGAVVFEGTAGDVWAWLRDAGRVDADGNPTPRD